MEKDYLADTTALIKRDFELTEATDPLTEEELFRLLANEIAYMLEHKLEVLLSLMYRLDIAEAKVNEALSPAAVVPANIGLAHLVLNRQKQRIFTKKLYKQDKLDDLEEGLEYQA